MIQLNIMTLGFYFPSFNIHRIQCKNIIGFIYTDTYHM